MDFSTGALSAWDLLKPFLARQMKTKLEQVCVKRLAYHSDNVTPGTLFFCLPGGKRDGHVYAAGAARRGAAALVISRAVHLKESGTPVIVVRDTRLALSAAAARFYGFPANKMKMIGITGTDGKTTTAYYVGSIFEAAGYNTAILGSNGLIMKGVRRKFALTTPQSLDLQEHLHFSRQRGTEVAAVEVSSHALVQQRAAHCRFDSVVYTNLTHEHLDYHRSMGQYLEAKSRLLGLLKINRSGSGVVLNADDFYYRDLVALSADLPRLAFGINAGEAVIKAVGLEQDEKGCYGFHLLGWPASFPVKLNLPGMFNVYNALAAAAVACREGLKPGPVAAGLNALQRIPGRFEEIEVPTGFTVIIDFAHTPEGLEQVLRLLSARAARRRFTLFGCPGERDRRKRPLMGRIAERYSDEVILTADNPAGEDFRTIIEDIKGGISGRSLVIPDRREAVFHVLSAARAGDLVLLAGKGAEEYQVVGEDSFPYSDRQTVLDYFCEKGLNYSPDLA